MTTQCVQVKLELGHRASFRKKPTVEGFTHEWWVFVRGPEGSNIQHFVDKVVFHLHDSFPKPKRVVKEPPYQVAESGYAGFTLPIEVYFKNKEEPKKVRFEYDLFLHLEGCPPVNHIRCEKLTFNNPTEDFRRKLIKAGGVGIIPGEATLSTPPSMPNGADESSSTSIISHTPKYMPEGFIKGKPYPGLPPPMVLPPKKQKSHSSKEKSMVKGPKEQSKTGNKEPKSTAAKAPMKRQPSPSPEESSKKKRKRSSSKESSHKSSKEKSSGDKSKSKEKKIKSSKPKTESHSSDLFAPEIKVERKPKPLPLPPKKDLPPFDAEVSTEEKDDDSNEAHSPSSSISFTSLPVAGAGALRTMWRELEDHDDDDDEDDDQEIVTPFQNELSQSSVHHSDSESNASLSLSTGIPVAPTNIEKPNSEKPKQKSPSHSSSSQKEKKKSSKRSSKNGEKKNKHSESRSKSSNTSTDLYLKELVDLHTKLMALRDRNFLQKVVNLIEETGAFVLTPTTFNFDLCSLDKTTVKKLQSCVEEIAVT
ncbi:protein ENL-like [Saccoglossus kowalevskii]|uniref:Protein AF-9-like n=1 Tax=Saccoglossus kowalevskii TaxID=10224 RepID=A0ABM0GLT8_SACKO|nr:PREDICTED: protein AF-9-like [Saccoglossus kowalevskii]